MPEKQKNTETEVSQVVTNLISNTKRKMAERNLEICAKIEGFLRDCDKITAAEFNLLWSFILSLNAFKDFEMASVCLLKVETVDSWSSPPNANGFTENYPDPLTYKSFINIALGLVRQKMEKLLEEKSGQ